MDGRYVADYEYAILELDRDWVLTRINPAGEATFPCRAVTALGQPVRPLFSAASLAGCAIWRAR
jgi:hypothetical protein